ncbi:MAG: acetyl-CoA carboxylase biotin carboxyl carrier protein subunit [Tannerella sp.]|jgi:pyruvate carboxylase|nr:acetyl-CoA carboxylase biotin carboxyl carrier protein subunit [Tannerella sp.]
MDKDISYEELRLEDGSYRTLLTEKYRKRTAWHKRQDGEVISGLPGLVVEIDAREGQTVKKGEQLLILEAMKMMNRVLAPLDGRIKGVHVGTGEKIGKDHLLFTIEPQ